MHKFVFLYSTLPQSFAYTGITVLPGSADLIPDYFLKLPCVLCVDCTKPGSQWDILHVHCDLHWQRPGEYDFSNVWFLSNHILRSFLQETTNDISLLLEKIDSITNVLLEKNVFGAHDQDHIIPNSSKVNVIIKYLMAAELTLASIDIVYMFIRYFVF